MKNTSVYFLMDTMVSLITFIHVLLAAAGDQDGMVMTQAMDQDEQRRQHQGECWSFLLSRDDYEAYLKWSTDHKTRPNADTEQPIWCSTHGQ